MRHNSLMSDSFDKAIQRFDAANAEDPNLERVDGKLVPKELIYGQRMSTWLDKLYPEASEALRLAVRAQHLRRWTIPRSTYPMDRRGYLRWRTDLKSYHAEAAADVLAECGYDGGFISIVQSLLRKEGLRDNPDTQALEDTACMVFLEFYFADFAAQHDDEKVVDIVRKTWAKMSERAHEAALGLSLSADAMALVGRALSQSEP